MERYLLFDSSCTTCTNIANEIEKETSGWLMARSLRDPNVQSILTQARTMWRWEPMVMEVDSGKAKIYSGPRMGIYLVLGLGPLRALRLATLVNRSISRLQVPSSDPGRRRFLWQTGTGLAALGFLLGWPESRLTRKLAVEVASVLPEETQGQVQSDLYEGFVLLPDGVPLPSFVQPPKNGMPHICGIGDVPANAINEVVGSVTDLRVRAGFPVFALGAGATDYSFSAANILRHSNGLLFNYQLATKHNSQEITAIVSMQPDYTKPYPIFLENSLSLEKVDFLPMNGLMIKGPFDYRLLWIYDNKLCSLQVDQAIDTAQIKSLAATLALVN